MNLVFGHDREAPADKAKYNSKLALAGVGIVLVLLVILLSFENADGGTVGSHLFSETLFGSTQVIASDAEVEITLEPNSWRSELQNSPPLGWDSQSQ
jgi:hypothetical protein